MGLLSDLIPRIETRAEKYLTGGAELMLSKNLSSSGTTVTERTAMTVAAVHLAVRVIAEGLGSLPVRIYHETKEHKGKRLAEEIQADYLLHKKPNPFQTPMQFKEMMIGHCVLRGFAVARKIFNNAGKVTALIPIHPSSVEFGYRENGEIFFKITHVYIDTDGLEKTTVEVLFQNEVFFLMGMSLNLYPISPIRAHAETIGVALATREHKTSFFGNSAMPSGILKHPGFFRDDQEKEIERLRAEFKEKFTGGNKFTTMVLQHGMEWQQLGMNNTDAELIKSEQFNVLEIARAFNVKPHKLMHLVDMGRANIEQMAIEHVTDTLRPWAVRFEESSNRDLLSDKETLNGFHAKFDFGDLVIGDTESRSKLYESGRQWGYLSINDIRLKENLTPLDPEVGDVYLSPLNMVNAAFAGRDQTDLPEIEGESPLANRSEIVESILRPVVKKIHIRREKNLQRAIEKGEIEPAIEKELSVARSMIEEVMPAILLLIPESREKEIDYESILAISKNEEKILESLLEEIRT
jgi:HK97 family phage portal protein